MRASDRPFILVGAIPYFLTLTIPLNITVAEAGLPGASTVMVNGCVTVAVEVGVKVIIMSRFAEPG